MNSYLKGVIENGLRRSGVAAAVRAVWRPDALILAYHNIVPEGESITGDLSLHLPQREFARQLDWLCRTHEIVPLAAIHETPRARAKPRAAITFDDAYRGAVTVGTRELADRDLPATIFVAPGFVGASGFWWDQLAGEDGVGLPSHVRKHCLEELDGRSHRVLAWAAECNITIRSVPDYQSVATEEELAACAATEKITFGSHTWSHPNLRRLEAPGLQEELERSLAWLKARFKQVAPWLAYPYGIVSTPAAEAAMRAGYEGAFAISGGRFTRRGAGYNRFAIPRTNISSALSFDGFVLRSSGLFSR